MTRTFTSISTEALGNDFTASAFPGTNVGTYVNDGLKELARRLDLPLAETRSALSLTAGTATVSLPSNFVRLESVFDETDEVALREVSPEDLDGMGDDRGTPLYFALDGQNIAFYPVPDTTTATRFYLRYSALPADLTGTDPVTGTIPDDYADLLVAWARYKMFRFEDDAEMSAFWRNEFEDTVKRMRGDLNRRGRSKRVIPGAWRRVPSLPRYRLP